MSEKTIIQPEVGLSVLVHRPQQSVPVPAIIAHVWNPRLVDVKGFVPGQHGSDRDSFSLTSIRMVQPHEAPPKGSMFCTWPDVMTDLIRRVDGLASPQATADEIAIDQMMRDKGLSGPRITPADIDAAIKRESFYRFPGTCTTVCCLMLANGFTVIGVSSPVAPVNFDQEIGERVAREDARAKIWALEGYRLRSKLTGGL